LVFAPPSSATEVFNFGVPAEDCLSALTLVLVPKGFILAVASDALLLESTTGLHVDSEKNNTTTK
jgi:hypothetical protein